MLLEQPLVATISVLVLVDRLRHIALACRTDFAWLRHYLKRTHSPVDQCRREEQVAPA
jgi:hypothetical protein